MAGSRKKTSKTTSTKAKQVARSSASSASSASSVSSPSTKTKKLPLALAQRVEAEVAAKRARLLKEARDDLRLIRRHRTQIEESFYAIGGALLRLKRPGVAEVLGRASFREVCELDLEMSLTSAEALIDIVQNVSREDALQLGQERVRALVALSKATPEADSATTLSKAKRALPSGKTLEVPKATTREIHAAAKEIRGATRSGDRPKGRTTTTKERERATALEKELRANGLERAKVSAVATKPGQEADIRIESVPMSALGRLLRALSKLK